MFKRGQLSYGKSPEPVTPYQRAAQAWDDRIGSARVQARNWRLMALGSLLLNGALGAGLIAQSLRGTIVPYIVEVDKLGEPRAIQPVTQEATPSDPMIAWVLAHFIEQVRSVSADPIVVRQNWLKAYDTVSDSGAAALNDYARVNDPFALVGRTQVSADVSSVIRASPSSFRIAWVERRYDQSQLSSTSRWTAILTIQLKRPTTPEQLSKNPLGVYVTAINWSKEVQP